ncbi:hypothetical protein LTR53_018214, partial [Teratosphaeriaceae sp. CCFEE 6253]
MESFNLDKLRSYIPENLPQMPKLPMRMPTWPASHNSMNPDSEAEDDEADDPAVAAQRDLPADTRPTEQGLSIAEPQPISSGPKSNLDLVN